MKRFNHLTIVLDSCRYDTYRMAALPTLNRHFDTIEAGAQATFTYAAHAAMFQGFYPSAAITRPLYNRFIAMAFGWERQKRELLFELDRDGKGSEDGVLTVPEMVRREGYRTVAIGAVDWFRTANPMSIGFEEFHHSTDVRVSVKHLLELLDRRPFYALLNLGETHRPYTCPWTTSFDVQSPLSANTYDSSYQPELHRKQVRALEYLDAQLEPLIEWLLHQPTQTVVCLCADHGETMGEDGCFGHGFYHPNVMSVPLAWTIFSGGKSTPVDAESLMTLEAPPSLARSRL